MKIFPLAQAQKSKSELTVQEIYLKAKPVFWENIQFIFLIEITGNRIVVISCDIGRLSHSKRKIGILSRMINSYVIRPLTPHT